MLSADPDSYHQDIAFPVNFPRHETVKQASFCLLFILFCFLLVTSNRLSCFLTGYDLTPTMRDVNKKFSVRYFLNLVLVDEEDRRYFKQQVSRHHHFK